MDIHSKPGIYQAFLIKLIVMPPDKSFHFNWDDLTAKDQDLLDLILKITGEKNYQNAILKICQDYRVLSDKVKELSINNQQLQETLNLIGKRLKERKK